MHLTAGNTSANHIPASMYDERWLNVTGTGRQVAGGKVYFYFHKVNWGANKVPRALWWAIDHQLR